MRVDTTARHIRNISFSFINCFTSDYVCLVLASRLNNLIIFNTVVCQFQSEQVSRLNKSASKYILAAGKIPYSIFGVSLFYRTAMLTTNEVALKSIQTYHSFMDVARNAKKKKLSEYSGGHVDVPNEQQCRYQYQYRCFFLYIVLIIIFIHNNPHFKSVQCLGISKSAYVNYTATVSKRFCRHSDCSKRWKLFDACNSYVRSHSPFQKVQIDWYNALISSRSKTRQ